MNKPLQAKFYNDETCFPLACSGIRKIEPIMKIMKLLAAIICIASVGCNSASEQHKDSSCNYFPNMDGALKIKLNEIANDATIYFIEIATPKFLNGKPLYALNVKDIGGREFEVLLKSYESEDKINEEAVITLDKRIVQDGVCVSATYGDPSVEYKLDTISENISLPKK